MGRQVGTAHDATLCKESPASERHHSIDAGEVGNVCAFPAGFPPRVAMILTPIEVALALRVVPLVPAGHLGVIGLSFVRSVQP